MGVCTHKRVQLRRRIARRTKRIPSGLAAPVWWGRFVPGPVGRHLMSTIDEHIQKDKSEIEAAKAAGDDAKVRHLEGELKGLEEYKSHHPEDSHDPTPLEVFCDMNPEAPECLVYDD